MRFFCTHESMSHANIHANGEQNANQHAKTTLIHGFRTDVHAVKSMGFCRQPTILLCGTRHFLNSQSPTQSQHRNAEGSANITEQELTVS